VKNSSINMASIGNSANSSAHGASQRNRSNPTSQSKLDGSQIFYSWLPHSTSLGASSTVNFKVRNANLTVGMDQNGNGGGIGVLNMLHARSRARGLSNSVHQHSKVDDEKKHNDSIRESVLLERNHGANATTTWSSHECRVEASIYAFGLPLQAAPISTRHASLQPFQPPMEPATQPSQQQHHQQPIPPLLQSTSHSNLYDASNPFFARGKEWATATFDMVVSLPVRWRDLTRDACLALNVYCDGDWGNCDDHVDFSATNESSGWKGQRASSSTKVWGTTLNLFDEFGKLRTGLYKLKLHPNLSADGGMGYASNDDANCSMETFLEGGATPGVPIPNECDMRSHPHTEWMDHGKLSTEEGEDPKWKASLILHELDCLESTTQSSNTSASSNHEIPGALPSSAPWTTPQSVPWLDALTRERCLDVLRDNDTDDDVHYNTDYTRQSMTQGQNLVTAGLPAPTSSNHLTPYLIIELPTPPIPVLHEEPLYPVETSSYLRGTTGSITANELIKFHSKFRASEKGEEKMSEWGGLTVRISPRSMEWPPVTSTKQSAKSPDNSKSNSNSNDADAILSNIPHTQAFLYPLVQIIDYEPPLTDENDSPQDNPAQDKYRILAHDQSVRALIDPGLKPDRASKYRIERIIGSPSYHLSTEEKDLLWRFRFSLVDNRRALTKFLLAVDWTVESEVVQAAELLEQWRKRSPIEVTDALKLLGRNVAFQTSLVRTYAIETLSGAPDEELRLYLLQLVQALKYEEDVSGGTSNNNGGVSNVFSHPANEGNPTRVSSLATFLIDRASRNVKLANFLYWYLRMEMLNPTYEARYREVFLSFKEKLSSVSVKDGVIFSPSKHSRLGKSSSTVISLWDLFSHQDQFISGIMDCQRNSLLVRGKKDAKQCQLREALETGGFQNIPHAVPLPSAPHIFVKGVNPSSVHMFKSALYPAVVDFIVDHVDAVSEKSTQTQGTSSSKSKSKNKPSMSMYKVMIKTGDDLRQDQLVIMMIQLMDRLLKRGTLDLCLKPYSIMAMPQNSGLVEFVEGSIPVSQILSNNNNSIMAYFQSVAPDISARHSIKHDVLQTYIRSCAGYCVLTYLLGVGDRHLDNIMIQPSGHFFHIDFGFIFGRDPKPLPPAFRLTKEMVDGMGGTESKEYRQFCSLACQAFNVLRKSAGLVLNLLHLMSDAEIEDLSNNPSADAIGVIAKVEERFKLELTDEQAESFFLGLISESLSALAPRVMEMFHQLSVARR